MTGTPLIALLGAPRSGTTWLQSLMAADPRVASPQESSLYSRFVAPLDESWHHFRRATDEEWARRRYTGLPAVLTEEQFRENVSQFVESSLQAMLALRPGASVVLEKSPSHSLHADLIAKYTPGPVHFVHVVRDGRDVAASLVAAAQGWGAAWAPPTIPEAARLWAESVAGASGAAACGPYHEIRYEDLRGADGADALCAVLEFCGLGATVAEARERLDAASFEKQRSATRTGVILGGEAAKIHAELAEPEGFFRQGISGGWSAWNAAERLQFETVAGAQLRTTGYETDAAWVDAPNTVRLVARGRAFGSRVLRGTGARLTRAADRFSGRR